MTATASKKPRRAKHNYTIAQRKTAKATPATGPLKISDSNGLYLHCAVSGSKTWMLAYRFNEKQKFYKVGPYPTLDIDDARDIAREKRKLLRAGIDPTDHDEQTRARNQRTQACTLNTIADEWFTEQETRWVATTTQKILNSYNTYARNGLGRLPIAMVDAAMIHTLIRGIAKRTRATGNEIKATGAPHVALRLRQALDAIFRYAIGTGRATINPVAMMRTRDAIKLPKARHNRALTKDELREVLRKLRDASMYRSTRCAIFFMLRTGARTSEVVNATWDEFDLDEALWSVPAERMKNRHPHLVPLSHQIVSMLRDLYRHTGHQQWVFLGRKGQPLCDESPNAVFKRIGLDGDDWFRGHGSRGTFATILAEEGKHSAEVVEKQLAHVQQNKVRLAYTHSAKFLAQRRALMQSWSDMFEELELHDEGQPDTKALQTAA